MTTILGRFVKLQEIKAKSILRRQKYIDSWFVAGYGMNLYRGCSHDCSYCDGRAESYYVEGDFSREISVKINALEILERELDPVHKRKAMQKGFILLGGGVCDAYQPVEQQFELAREVLKLCQRYGHPVMVLTKSDLVLRDLDILKEINQKKPVLVCCSLSSVDERLSRVIEPGVPSPAKRLDMLRTMRQAGIHTGVFLLPVLPFMSDNSVMLSESLKEIRSAGVEFINFGGMTLKPGRQETYYLEVLRRHYPDLAERYKTIYKGDKWGNATPEYYEHLYRRFHKIWEQDPIALRMPDSIYKSIVGPEDLIRIKMEHLAFYEKAFQTHIDWKPYIHLMYSQREHKLELLQEKIQNAPGVIKQSIQELIETQDCGRYRDYFSGTSTGSKSL